MLQNRRRRVALIYNSPCAIDPPNAQGGEPVFYVKFQIACLLVVLYLLGVYLHDSRKNKVPLNPLFTALLACGAVAIVFDGTTSWTVNHIGQVSAWLNLALHAGLYLSMDVVIILAFMYMIDLVAGKPQRASTRALLLLPGALSILGIIAFLPSTYYVVGKTTWYSMGPSVIIAYLCLTLHFAAILVLVFRRRYYIERRKFTSLSACLLLAFLALFVQTVWPESLISALFPTFLALGFYINIEDPSMRRLERFNSTMVMGFATLVENRDNSTGGHIRRTRGYVSILLEAMRQQPQYARVLTRDYVRNVIDAAPMHDIGKIATPDSILQKPGRLTDEEFAIMREHAAIGGDIIRETFADIDDPEYAQIAFEMARWHHEKWNGRGYPDSLSGEEIPLHARVMAIADVFDAVSAKRCYRDALPLDVCFKIIQDGAGTDFDPVLAQLFLQERTRVSALCASER